ncbi:PUA-like domain-containing protein [Dunaliella salina]|uniref:PUA-like domain-containing protein n=1 Tax=Dunaliella salina TaxID=3046 RepID=A0ABQ7FUN8_DUNSA|nr:PUA-like domain-containing protein [Dunaliella salina]|eukprot:KAF5826116.1 PUA-like domain-containing protein [Dunaliella salina]
MLAYRNSVGQSTRGLASSRPSVLKKNHAFQYKRTNLSHQQQRLHCKATQTLPIFPLSLVALPSSTVPLVIFEARYRVLFNTLLAGEPGVEEGLVQKDSAICGTKKFGMCFMDREGRLASIGTLLEIQDFAHMQDGRIFVTTMGKERFEIKKVTKEKPVLLCEVEFMNEEEDAEEANSEKAKELAKEVADLMRATIRLNVKMKNISASEDQLEPEGLAELSPKPLSFFVASFFSDVRVLQQNLLEETSTLERLKVERDILSDTVRYFSATLV